MTYPVTTSILCPGCLECAAGATGYCDDCTDFLRSPLQTASWSEDEYVGGDAYDRARDRDEEDRCHAD